MINKLNIVFGSVFLLLSIFFYLYPDYDIMISRLFFDAELGFLHSHNFLVKILFKTVPALTIIFALILIFQILRGYFLQKLPYKKILLYLTVLTSLAVGPGIIVNSVLKESFGRARPKQIMEFGANKNFSKIYTYSDQCIKNCSFSSGHAAAAFSFSTISLFLSPAHQVTSYIIGILYGCFVGLGRIVQGGHFISDVLASGWIVLYINYFFLLVYQKLIKFLHQNHKE